MKFLLSLYLFVIVFVACGKKKYHVISTTTRQILSAPNNYFRMVVLDNSNCNLQCKEQLTYAAINDHSFKIELKLKIEYHFISNDSIVNKDYILNSGDSIVVACGCENLNISKFNDWNTDVMILSVKKID